jgi:transcriptional regulator with XRE-family HTH domain
VAKKKTRGKAWLNSGGKLRRHRPYTKYGDRIAALGVQKEIAKALGITQQTVSKKLRGECGLYVTDLEKIAKKFKVPMTYFVE